MVIWLVALTQRAKLSQVLPAWSFNTMQVGLIALTFFALASLIGAVANGLLGYPDMQIAGYGSNAYQLNWYQDRTSTQLPEPVILSVPLWVYRLLMLLWALWLAITVLSWLRWGWQAFSTGGLWQSTPKKVNRAAVTAPTVANSNPSEPTLPTSDTPTQS
jgi:hypothetical protein